MPKRVGGHPILSDGGEKVKILPVHVIERDELCHRCQENRCCQVYDVKFQLCYWCWSEAVAQDTMRQVARWGSE
jgi:hypothetical protein